MSSEEEHHLKFKELSLLQVWVAELCLTIVGMSQARSTLSARM
jgi:hypothetical protein